MRILQCRDNFYAHWLTFYCIPSGKEKGWGCPAREGDVPSSAANEIARNEIPFPKISADKTMMRVQALLCTHLIMMDNNC